MKTLSIKKTLLYIALLCTASCTIDPPINPHSIYRIKNRNCSVEDLMEFIKGPDFPTGGIVQGKEGIYV